MKKEKLAYSIHQEIIRLRKNLNDVYQHRMEEKNVSDVDTACGTVRQTQLTCLRIIRHLKTIFEEHNICYWLDFGALLGAVRHKGFIPWDDDMDICCLRKDYERIPEILEANLSNQYEIRTHRDDHFQIRIIDKMTRAGVDIFVVDGVTVDFIPERDEKALNDLIVQAGERIVRLCAHDASLELNLTKIKSIIKNLTAGFRDDECRGDLLFYGIDYPFSNAHYVMRKSDIFPIKERVFEGIHLPVPAMAEKHLHDVYGEYNTWPQNLFTNALEFDSNEAFRNVRREIRRRCGLFHKEISDDLTEVKYFLFGFCVCRRFRMCKMLRMLQSEIASLERAVNALR